MVQKLTKQNDFPLHLGAFKPTGHVVVTLEDDGAAQAFAAALNGEGIGADDVLVFTGAEMAARLRPLVDEASGAAGFGSEIQAMRAYLKLADEGAGSVIVYAPEEQVQQRVGALAGRHKALQARMYNRLTVEELV